MSTGDERSSDSWTPRASRGESLGVHDPQETPVDPPAEGGEDDGWESLALDRPATGADDDGEDLGFEAPELWRGEEDGPLPLRWEPGHVSWPDLTRIDQAVWPEVLTPLPYELRRKAARNQYLGPERNVAASELARSLPPSATDRAREAVRKGMSIPIPRAERPGWRQMTVRIPARNYEDLTVAATMLGTRPAELARMFILNGTRRALADQDAGGR